MNKSKVKVGMTVVVNELLDTQHYTVAELNGYNARLTYKVGDRVVGGGTLDVSSLRKPTKRQLASV